MFPNFVHSVIYCEFDLQQGPSVRLQYPTPLSNVPLLLLADQILPDGIHERPQDSNYFIINQKALPPPLHQSFAGCHVSNSIEFPQKYERSCFHMNEIPITLFYSVKAKNPCKFLPLSQLKSQLPDCAHTVIQSKKGQNFLTFQSKSRVFFEIPINHSLQLSYLNPSHLLLSSPSFPFHKHLPSFLVLRFGSHASLLDFYTTVSFLLSSHPYTPSSPSPTPHKDKISPSNSLIGSPQEPTLYCFSTAICKKSNTYERGCRVAGLCVTSPFNFINCISPLLEFCVESLLNDEVEALDVCRDLYDVLSQEESCDLIGDLIDGGFDEDSYFKCFYKRVMGVNTSKRVKFELNSLDFWLTFDPFRLFDDFPLNLVELIPVFKEKLMILYNAILFNRTVVILFPEASAWDCCSLVLMLVQLVAPLRGFLTTKVFPFSTLINQSYLDFPGSITSTSNPLYLEQTSWFDVLFNVSDGEIVYGTHSSTQVKMNGQNSWSQEDSDFISTILRGIAEGSATTHWIRQCFYYYTRRIISFALSSPNGNPNPNANPNPISLPMEQDIKGLASNEGRIALLQLNPLFVNYQRDLFYYNSCLKSGTNIQALVVQLTTDMSKLTHSARHKGQKELKKVIDIRIADTFIALSNIMDCHNSILEFTTLLSLSSNGIDIFSLGLFHWDSVVRRAVCTLLVNLESLPEGNIVMDRLSSFSRAAFEKIKLELTS
ncbi:hypothetical protein P9112_011341 [Eukaryota sp. TZLM1-RC]